VAKQLFAICDAYVIDVVNDVKDSNEANDA
jgi:hypothetical protein